MKYFSHSWDMLLAMEPDDIVEVDLKLDKLSPFLAEPLVFRLPKLGFLV